MRRILLVVTALLFVLMLSFAVAGCRKNSENKGGGGYLPAPRSTELTAVVEVSRTTAASDRLDATEQQIRWVAGRHCFTRAQGLV